MKAALTAVGPGAKVCVFGDLTTYGVPWSLEMNQSGTAQQPIQIVGDGQTTVSGVTVMGNFVTISGINSVEAEAPAFLLTGNNITLENSTAISPKGGNANGIAFSGSDITIRHNTVRNTRSVDSPANCIRGYPANSQRPGSRHVVIDSNRCEQIDAACLYTEGPNGPTGNGLGFMTDIVFTNNNCQSKGREALYFDDVQGITVTGNEFTGTNDHLVTLLDGSAGARIDGNQLSPNIRS